MNLSSDSSASSVASVGFIRGFSNIKSDRSVNRERKAQSIYVIQYDDCYGEHGVIVRDVFWEKVPQAKILCRHIYTRRNAFTGQRKSDLSEGLQTRMEPDNKERSSQFSYYSPPQIHHRIVTISLSGPLQGQVPPEHLDPRILYVVAADNDSGLQGPEREAYKDSTLHFLTQSTSIVVIALDFYGQSLAFYSSRCGWARENCMAAPGTVLKSDGSSTYGTSFATPTVSAAAAAIFQYWPELSAVDVKKILFSCAKDLGAEGNDVVYGHGGLSFGSRGRGEDHCLLEHDILDTPQQRSSTSLNEAFFAHHRHNIHALAYHVPQKQGWNVLHNAINDGQERPGISWKQGAIFLIIESSTYQVALHGERMLQGNFTTGYTYQKHSWSLTALTRTSYTTNMLTTSHNDAIHTISGALLTQISYTQNVFRIVLSTGVHMQKQHHVLQNDNDMSVFLHAKVHF